MPVTIPDLYCPFPAALNPEAETVQTHTLMWVRKHSLFRGERDFERLQAAGIGYLIARAYPTARLARLCLIADWNTWLFLADDEYDETPLGKRTERMSALHERFMEILTSRIGYPAVEAFAPDREGRIDYALIRGLADIRSKMARLMSREWLSRFIQSVTMYWEACFWEADNRERGVWPDTANYMRMRIHTVGLPMEFNLTALSEEIDLPISVREHPALQRLEYLANTSIAWTNDIFSMAKERAHDDTHNLCLILDHEEGLGDQGAVDAVARLVEGQVREFVAQEETLARTGIDVSGPVGRFIDVMRAWMRGNLDWSRETGRYR